MFIFFPFLSTLACLDSDPNRIRNTAFRTALTGSNPMKELTYDELLKPALVSIVLEALNASLHPLLPGQISCTRTKRTKSATGTLQVNCLNFSNTQTN
jgi:hypothetical protein